MRTSGQTLRLGALTLEWGQRTFIMGVVNVTPDSFSGDGVQTASEAVDHARQMLADGADVIDVGGESTRPGAAPVPVDEELRRVVPVVQALVRELGAVVSIDTQKADVARRGLDAGAAMINDVSAFRTDPAMAAVVAAHRAPVVLMHGYGGTMAPSGSTGDVMAEVVEFLRDRIEFAVAAGIPRESILVDPGFGFGKTVEQNLDVLRHLGRLRVLGQPIVIGPSRKGTIGRLLGGLPVHDRVEGTAAAVVASIVQGADMIRVHDVHAMATVARMTDLLSRVESSVPRRGGRT